MLLNSPFVKTEESLCGYLHRLLRSNHYRSAAYLLELLGVPENRINNNDFDEKDILAVSKISGHSMEELSVMSGINLRSLFGTFFFEKLMMKRRVKYCPKCLQISGIHKLVWTIFPIDVCLDHLIKLVEFCPCCSNIILLKDLMLGKCSRCGFRYTLATSCKVIQSTFLYLSQLDLDTRINNPHNLTEFPHLSLPSYLLLIHQSFYLLEGLDSYIEDYKRPIHYFHKKNGEKRTSESTAHAWANAYWMYLDFPNHFFRILEAFHLCKMSQLKYFLLGRFEQLFKYECFRFIKDAYNSFWLQKLDEGTVRIDFAVFKNNPSLLEERKFIRKDEVRKNFGFSYEYIQQLNAEQKLRLITKERGSIKGYFIENETLHDVLVENEKLITKKEAALMLGISSSSIQRLIHSGLLQTYKITSTSIEKLDRVEVQNLIDSCRGILVKAICDGYIQFHDALNKFSVCHLSVERIFEFTLKGILHPICLSTEGNFADNYYLVDELFQCKAEIKAEYQSVAGYYMCDVMRKLSIGEKKMRRFMQEGKIIPNQIVLLSDGRKHYLFDKERIDTLCRKEIKY